MDKITKLLKKLSEKERIQVSKILALLISGKIESLNIKKLKGANEVYRARVGTLRIIFSKASGTGDIRIIEIGRRSENTYCDT